jgi:hypothetical protein
LVFFFHDCFLSSSSLTTYNKQQPKVHAEDGARIGCGILHEVSSTNDILTTTLHSFNNSGVKGAVTAHRLTSSTNLDTIEFPLNDLICFYVTGHSLSPNTVSFLVENSTTQDCNVTNGCGVHVHTGTSCESATTQMGHYYNNQTFRIDPWILTNYHTTDQHGRTSAAHCVATGEMSFQGRTFILHEKNGVRVACGLLESSLSSLSTSNGDKTNHNTTKTSSSAFSFVKTDLPFDRVTFIILLITTTSYVMSYF